MVAAQGQYTMITSLYHLNHGAPVVAGVPSDDPDNHLFIFLNIAIHDRHEQHTTGKGRFAPTGTCGIVQFGTDVPAQLLPVIGRCINSTWPVSAR